MSETMPDAQGPQDGAQVPPEAWARVPLGELTALLSDVTHLVSVAGYVQDEITYQARTAGLSWEMLGQALGVERSTARERFQRIARDRGARTPNPLRDNDPGWIRVIHSAILAQIEKASRCPFCQHSEEVPECPCIAEDCACCRY